MSKDKIQGVENSFKSSNRFDNAGDLYTAFNDIVSDTKEVACKRETLIKIYDKTPTKNPRTKKIEPDHGQFRMKVDNYMAVFIDFLTESTERFKVNCLFSDEKKKDSFGRSIHSVFTDVFFKSWEEMFQAEVSAIFDMALFSKGIMYWPNKVGYRAINVPVNDVFPDLDAKMNPETWNLLFVRKKYTLIELYDMAFGEDSTELMRGWNKEAIERLLCHPSFAQSATDTALELFNTGRSSQKLRDTQVSLLECYVKEYKKDKDGNRVSKYVINESEAYFSESTEDRKKPGLLFVDKSYCKCISNIIATRSTSVTRSYWKSPSFGELIYLACKLYDQTTNAIIRAVIRNMTIFLKGGTGNNDDYADKLRTIGSSEVEVLEGDLEVSQSQIRIPINEASAMIRGIVFDLEKEQPSGQGVGSQNTKGYAITAKEAELRSSGEESSQSILIKMFSSLDRFFYREIYRRAIESPSTEEKRFTSLFEDRMKTRDISKKDYNPDNVIIEPAFSFGGDRNSKVGFARSLYQAVSINASSDAQKKAKRMLVSAHVGEANVLEFFDDAVEIENLLTVQQKAGGENEDMDNPNLNPQNIPVSKDDNHEIELAFHIKDYEYKLSFAKQMIDKSMQMPPILKMIFINSALDVIRAQDIKGSHIEAHFKYLSEDPTVSEEFIKSTYATFDNLRKSQDALQIQAESEFSKHLKENEQDATLTIEQRHKQMMSQLEIEHAKQMNEIGLGKALEQKELAKEKAATKTAQDYAQKEALGGLKIEQKKTEVELEALKKQIQQ